MILVAVVGVGALGEHHARHLAALPGAELVCVIDVREERARRVADQLGVHWGTNYRSVLDRVEAVSLAVPTRQHRDIAVDFLQRGIHVMVEKPIADSLEGADCMIEAAAKGGAILQVGHSERFNPALQVVQPYVKDPRFFEAHRLGIFVTRSLDIDVVLDLMIHDLDIIGWFVKSPLKSVHAVGIPILTSRIDIANARLEFENGCVANVTASRVSNEKVRKLRFFQAHDYVSIDFHEQQVSFYSLMERDGRREIVDRKLEVSRAEPLRVELEAFLRAVGNKTKSECGGQEGRAALDLAQKILAAMKQ
ncbi:MAG TPA: Gfo/Idh/MocA family oxidoreductase [Acidobacteriota bacterium]|jgi:predicted dehydrogenase|nr:Gfo/Idh/MocA family oxidoreductase [Acidobacteriota bacterium]